MTKFSNDHLTQILAFFDSALPGEMPNALMDQLTRYLKRERLLAKDVDTDPDTSDFIHEYVDDSDDSDSDDDASTISDPPSSITGSTLSSWPSVSERGEQVLSTPSHNKNKNKPPPPPPKQCKGHKADGTRCTFRATHGKYCGHHIK